MASAVRNQFDVPQLPIQAEIAPETEKNINVLRELCLEKYYDQGKKWSAAIKVASLALAIFAGIALGKGFLGFVVGAATYSIVNTAVSNLFEDEILPSKNYLEYADAMKEPEFAKYFKGKAIPASMYRLPEVMRSYRDNHLVAAYRKADVNG